jgi:2-polyprenyl-3-methyl-5-hydroxy-6-metoxy-1,4-benzoquinol methylase
MSTMSVGLPPGNRRPTDQTQYAAERGFVSCLLCGSPGRALLVDASGVTIRWCSPCQLGFTDPPPVVDYADYSAAGDRDVELWLSFAKPILRYARKVAASPPSSWLDFGAGSGELVLAAQRAGIDAVGVDVDNRASALAWSRGARILSSLEEVSSRRFDIVSASHVLEHLLDPVQTTKALSAVLAPRGLLLVVQPNPLGLLPRLWPDRWPGWRWTEHLWHLTPRSMAAVMERAGLCVVDTKSTSLHHPVMTARSIVPAMVARFGRIVARGDAFYMAGAHGADPLERAH